MYRYPQASLTAEQATLICCSLLLNDTLWNVTVLVKHMQYGTVFPHTFDMFLKYWAMYTLPPRQGHAPPRPRDIRCSHCRSTMHTQAIRDTQAAQASNKQGKKWQTSCCNETVSPQRNIEKRTDRCGRRGHCNMDEKGFCFKRACRNFEKSSVEKT